MPEIQSKQLCGVSVLSAVQSLLGSSECQLRGVGGGSLAHLCVVCLLSAGLMAGCGNKGDLYLESDVVAADELEDAAEKLKKRKNQASE